MPNLRRLISCGAACRILSDLYICQIFIYKDIIESTAAVGWPAAATI
jgi:hypothetical protein